MSSNEIATVPSHAGEATASLRAKGAIVRLAMMMTHYRMPIDFTRTRLREAEKRLVRWITVAERHGDPRPPSDVVAALCDDLNTPKAIAEIDKLAKNRDGRGVYAAMRLLGLIE